MKSYDIQTHIQALELLLSLCIQQSPKEVIEFENISMEDLFSRIQVLIHEEEYLYALTPTEWQILYQYIDYYRYKPENQKKVEVFNQMIDDVNDRLYLNEIFYDNYQKIISTNDQSELSTCLNRYSSMCNSIFSRYFKFEEKIPCYESVSSNLIHVLWQTKYILLVYIVESLLPEDYQVLEDTVYAEAAMISIINQHKDELTNQHYEKMIQLIIDRNKEEHLLKNSVSKEHKTLFKTKTYINTKETIHAGEMILNYIENELEQKKLKKSK